jgi:hypothetical protein
VNGAALPGPIPDLQGDAFCRAYAAEADEWLSGVADRAVGETNRHLALLAVGGLRQGLLCPYSDLDVVLVHRGHRDIKAVADAIWYPVWDEGCTSTIRCAARPRCSPRRPTTSGSPSACSTPAWSGATPRWPIR